MGHNPFEREISHSDVKKVNDILDEFDLIEIDRKPPDSLDVLAHHMRQNVVWNGVEYSNLLEIVNAIVMLSVQGKSTNDQLVKTLIYGFGVALYDMAIDREIPADAINVACTYFEFTVTIDPRYYQGYNRLGDTWLWVADGVDEAISWQVS